MQYRARGAGQPPVGRRPRNLRFGASGGDPAKICSEALRDLIGKRIIDCPDPVDEILGFGAM